MESTPQKMGVWALGGGQASCSTAHAISLGTFLGFTRRIPVIIHRTTAPHFNGRFSAMRHIEAAIVETLQRSGPCCLDDVVMYLPNFSWGEVFLAVDRMSRDGRLLLRQLGGSTYQIELRSQLAYSHSASQSGQTTSTVMPIPQVAA